MKYTLIMYTFKGDSEADWHNEIAQFVEALNTDPDLSGKISYRAMKTRGGSDYYHLAIATDDEAAKLLQSKEFFSRYTAQNRIASGGETKATPLEIVAETSYQP